MYPSAPWGSYGSFGFISLMRARTNCRRVHLGFIRERTGSRWVHFWAPWGSLGSLGFVWFIQMSGGRRVHFCSLVSIMRAVGFVGCIRERPGDLWLHSGAP